jgi:primosomal protein N' (replication factor Y)
MDHSTRAGTSSASSTRVVDVLVPVALNQAYSYRVPRGMELKPGDVVCVPLGPREVVAVVWAENANPDPRLHNRLKDVGEKLDVPPLKEELRALVDWVANYTLSARGMVLRMTLRMGEHLGPERMRMGVRLIGAAAHDPGTAAADRNPLRWPAARQVRSRERSRRQRRRD